MNAHPEFETNDGALFWWGHTLFIEEFVCCIPDELADYVGLICCSVVRRRDHNRGMISNTKYNISRADLYMLRTPKNTLDIPTDCVYPLILFP